MESREEFAKSYLNEILEFVDEMRKEGESDLRSVRYQILEKIKELSHK